MPEKETDLQQLRIDREPPAVANSSKRPFLLLLILIVGYIGFKEWPQGRDSGRQVRVAAVERRGGISTATGTAANGYVVARRRAALSTDIPGRLIELNVEEGTRVRQGDVVARLDSRELEATRDRMAADLQASDAEQERARLELERQQNLIASADTTRSALEVAIASERAASARVLSQGAALREIETRIDKSTVYAPFDGVIVEKNAEVGEVVSTLGGAASTRGAVATLVDFETLEVQVELAQTSLSAARLGAPLVIYLDAWPDNGYRGRVRQVWPIADRAKATVELRAEFLDKDEKVLPEMAVRVVFVPDNESNPAPPQVLILRSALVLGEEPAVFVVTDGTVSRRSVTLRDDVEGGRVEVGSGLIGGERVVIDPPGDLADGDRVEIGRN